MSVLTGQGGLWLPTSQQCIKEPENQKPKFREEYVDIKNGANVTNKNLLYRAALKGAEACKTLIQVRGLFNQTGEEEGRDKLKESLVQGLVTVAHMQLMVGSRSLDEEAHDDVRAGGVHRVRQALPDLVHREVELAGAQRLDAQSAKLDKSLLVLGGNLVRTLELSLSSDYILADQVLYQSVVHLCHLLRQFLVLSKYVAEKLAQEGTSDQALVSLVAKEQLKQTLGQTRPILEVILHHALDLLPVEPLDGDHLGELVELDLGLGRVERPRSGEHLITFH